MEQSEEHGLVTSLRWNIAKGVVHPYFKLLFFFFFLGVGEGCVDFCHRKVTYIDKGKDHDRKCSYFLFGYYL